MALSYPTDLNYCQKFWSLSVLISANVSLSMPCPCGSKQLFGECCSPYLQGNILAPTAEKLMRSRYSAYFLKNIDYLLKTHHPTRREPNERQAIATTANSMKWLGLTILATQAGQPKDQTGVVEFVALYQAGNRIDQLHERSRFLKKQGRWFYLDGDILPPLQPIIG